jgi:RHS repeat-associated protein
MNDAALDNKYQYNGKEWNDDFGLNWNEYGARWYDGAVGRFMSIDPLSDIAPEWIPYRYAFNNPISYIDPDGLFETRKEAKQYAKENNIKTGWLGNARIAKQEDGTFAIISTSFGSNGNILQSFIQDFGGEIGIATGVIVRATDEMDRKIGWFSDDVTLRDGSLINEPHKTIGPPVARVASGGVTLASIGVGKIIPKVAPKLPSLDATGKVHGALPKVQDLAKYSKEELKILLKELKLSVQQRIKVTSRLGRDRGHGQRQGAEQDLIKSIEKYLENSK